MSESTSTMATILQCSISNRHLIFLPREGYCFAGSFRFQCLFGEVTVAGYTLKSGPFDENAFIQFTVHNKAQIPLNFVPTIKDDDENNADLLFQRVRFIMEGSANDFKSFSQYPAAILVDVAPTVVESYLTSRIGEFHKPLEKFSYRLVAGDCYIVYGLREEFGKIKPLDLHIPNLDTVHNAIEYVLKSGNKLMVTGNKNVGKSTMARYILNYLLSKTDSTVYLLDTDIGQTEFTPPGCVSLFQVDGPILTPTFLHQKKNFTSTYCIGSLSPAQDLKLYEQCIRKLTTEFNEITNPKKFLVINTHGWVDGAGREIMKNLFAVVKPTTVLNMYSPDKDNFDIPSMSFVQNYFQYKVEPRVNSSTSGEIKPRTWREYTITGYFANCLGDERFGKPSPDRTLASLMSYQVFFEKVGLYFHVERQPVVDNLVFCSLNCSIVALCGFAPEVDRQTMLKERYICNDPRWPKIFSITDPGVKPLLKCYGYGFIRAISLEKRNFYIISPLMLEDFSKIDVLFIPHNISAPNFMFDRDDADAAPYLVEFRNEEEREAAVKSRSRCLQLLSTKFQNKTAVRNVIRTTNTGNAYRQPSNGSGPARKRPRNQ